MQKLPEHEPCCYTLVFVPGILGECVKHIATPFSDSYRRLTDKGHRIYVVPVEGRASSERNARIISDFLASPERQLGKVVLIGYSKGVSDTLEALALDQDAAWLKKVVALVSVAGVVAGTPAADTFAGLYAAFFSKLPWPTCAPGDAGGLGSLRRQVRADFLARNKLPEHIKYYSLVAAARLPHVNPLLVPLHEALLADGPNDGQVVARDAIIPGSYLLGFVNSDHWALALPFNRSGSKQAELLQLGNAFPREVLIDAILEFVAATLER